MTTDLKTVQQLATEHILDDARRAHDIGADVLGHFGPDALTKAEYHAYCDAIREAITTATVAVSWPDEQPQADDTPDAERLAQIRDRNRRLVAVPFETHGGGHGPGCIPCELVRAVDDVRWLLGLLEKQQAAVEQAREEAAARAALGTSPAVWCWSRHPDHPLPCGRFAGHEGPHVRGEHRWDAEQQPEDGERG